MKNKRQFLWLALAIALLLCAFGLASCVRSEDLHYGDCKHEWVEATCKEPRHCTKCDATEGGLADHKGGEASCTEKAICEVCGKAYGEPAGHDWVEATCKEPRHCDKCDATEGGLADHKGGEASCTEKAICEVCGEAYGEPAGHHWVEATCTKPRHCDKCEVTEGEVKGHTWDAGVVTKKASCTENGVRTYTCVDCKETKTEQIPATEHAYTTKVVAPTCTEKGYTEHICPNCNTSYKDTEVAAKGHRWDHETPSCSSGRTCLDCSETEAALAHNYVLTGTDGATCTTPEQKHYTCSGCGDTYTQTTGSALRHDFTGSAMTERLVAENGCLYEQLYHCSRCNQDIVTDTVTHHSYQASIKKEATCSTDGLKGLTCKTCGHYTTETIEKNENAHVWDAGELNGSIRTYHCTAGCGKSKTAVDASAKTAASVKASDLASTKEVQLKNASMALDQKVLDSIGQKDVTLSAGTLEGEIKAEALKNLSEEQKKQLGDNPIYNFTMTDGGESVSFDGGYVTVTIPYTLSEGEDVDHIAVWYVNGTTVEAVKATYSNGYVTFRVSHFSYYTVTRLTPKQRCELYGHTETRKTVPATCLSDGYTLVVCVRCGATWKENEVTAKGHQYVLTLEKASCTKDGKETYTCSACGDHYENRIPATGHHWKEVSRTEADCTKAGNTTFACEGCEETRTETTPQLLHNFAVTVVAPTCEVGGYTLHRCERCGYEYRDAQLAATGHAYAVRWAWAKDHTSATPTVTCRHCDLALSQDAVTAEQYTTASTCQVKGGILYTVRLSYNGELYTDTYREELSELAPHQPSSEKGHNEELHWSHCTVCKEKLLEEKHAFDKGEVTLAPTCNTEGTTVYRCACGYEKIETIPATEDHHFEKDYNNDGHYEICSVCGMFRNEEAHTLTETVTVPASCTLWGEKKLSCACGYERMEKTPVNPDAHPAGSGMVLYEENGHYYVCPDCGAVTVEKVAHVFGEAEILKEATCRAPGSSRRVCTVCDFILQEVILPTGNHNYLKEWDYDEGSHWHNCELCGRDVVSEKAEHTFEREETIRDAICGQEGLKRRYCFCGYFVEESIPAPGSHKFETATGSDEEGHWWICDLCGAAGEKVAHTFETAEVLTPATCTAPGAKRIRCTVCGQEKTAEIPVDPEAHGEMVLVPGDEQGHYRVCKLCGKPLSEAEAHTPTGEWTTVLQPGCSTEGLRTASCACGYSVEETIPATGKHQYDDVLHFDDEEHYRLCRECRQEFDREGHTFVSLEKSAPTCSKPGLETFRCVYCDAVKSQTIPATGEHVFSKDLFLSAGVKGHLYRCAVCGTESELEAHTFEDTGTILVEASCNNPGVKWVRCTVCQYETTTETPIDPNVHSLIVWFYTEEGHYRGCIGCDQYRGEMQPHQLAEEWVITQKPTCGADGVKRRSCECGYYIEEAIPATGEHTPVQDFLPFDGQEHWHICSNCSQAIDREEHILVADESTRVPPTCNTDGQVGYRCEKCAYANLEKLEATGEHIYTDHYEYSDGEGHWLCCDSCGTAGEMTAHTQSGEAVITRVPNCTEAGEGYIPCVCGYHFYMQFPADKNAHNYVNGVCTRCKAKDPAACDHTTFQTKVVDLASLGGCGGTITVQVCDCGEVMKLDVETFQKEMMSIPCFSGNTIVFTKQTATEMEGTCSHCGLYVYVTASSKAVEGTCDVEFLGKYTMRLGSTTFLKDAQVRTLATQHGETKDVTLDMQKEYGACAGGVVKGRVCTACGEFVSSPEISPSCKIKEPETSTYVDADGYTHMCQEGTCTACGLTYRMEMVQSNTICTTTYETVMIVIRGDEELLRSTQTQIYESHDFTYTYTMKGSSCADGYVETARCSRCEYEYTSEGQGHQSDEEPLRMDLSEYEPDAMLYVEKCRVCQKAYRLELNGCNERYTNETTETTADGETYYVMVTACHRCTLRLEMRYRRVTVDTCRTDLFGEYQLYAGETLLTSGSFVDREVNHQIKRTYKDLKGSCDDGYTVVNACENCDYFVEYSSSGHSCGEESVDYSDKVPCGLVLSVDKCEICGQISYYSYEKDGCRIRWQDPVETVEDGVSHHRQTGTCATCGTVYVTDEYQAMTDSCHGTMNRVLTVTASDGTQIVQLHTSSEFTDHDIRRTYEMKGSTCDDGYSMVETCTKCNQVLWSGESSGHDYGEHEESLSQYLDCGGSVIYQGCRICHAEERIVAISTSCDFAWSWSTETDANGVVHEIRSGVCTKCGKRHVCDEWTKWTTACEGERQCTYSIYAGEDLLVSYTYSQGTTTNHQDVYTFQLNGETCDDGYTIIHTCSVCGRVEKEYERYGHNAYPTRICLLTEFGACRGKATVYSCACGQEKWMDFNDLCGTMSYTSNSYTDEDGIRHDVSIRRCEVCGLTIQNDSYSVKTPGKCERIAYQAMTITLGEQLILSEVMQRTEEAHNLEETVRLVDGAKSCADGVIHIAHCTDCDYHTENTEFYHSLVLQERVDLSPLGSVCGGYLDVTGCACGADRRVDLHADCKFDSIGISADWLGTCLTETQNSSSGIAHFYPYATIFTCAVTDPACGFVIRNGNYWIAEENSCYAIRYEKWQIGYDAETGTCAKELVVATERHLYHRYVDGKPEVTTDENGNKVLVFTSTCSLCGSFVRETRVTAPDETELRSERYAENHMPGEYYRSYTEIWDHTFLPEGDGWVEGCKTIQIRIGEDGTEVEYYETASAMRANGRGCEIYGYRRWENGEKWERRDFSYDFSTCTVTETMTDQSGESRTQTYVNHGLIYEDATLEPTCTQYGLRRTYCPDCGYVEEESQIPPRGHCWVRISENLYACKRCGLENANGADGDVEMEDLSVGYGDDDTYVVGIRNSNNISYVYYVCLILHAPAEGEDDMIVLTEIAITEHQTPFVGFSFSRSAVEAAASKLGYAPGTYDVRFTLVPKDAGGSLDYGVTFTPAIKEDAA